MILYDIHTHSTVPNTKEYTTRAIINISPHQYADKVLVDNAWKISCGIHPWDAHDYEKELNILNTIATDKHITAIGEAGLDTLATMEISVQKAVFRKQIECSIEVDKPMIIHNVRAWDALIALYKEFGPKQKWVIHGFRGKKEQAVQLTDLGFFLSYGFYFNKDAILHTPLHKLFLETDTADCAIQDLYIQVASILQIDVFKLSELIECNVNNTFL